MEFRDIFFVVIVPVLAALVVGIAVNFLARMRAQTRSKQDRRRIEELQAHKEQLESELAAEREISDARQLLLLRLQESYVEPIDVILKGQSISTAVSIEDEPESAIDIDKGRLQEIADDIEQFRQANVSTLPNLSLNLGTLMYVTGRYREAARLFEDALGADATSQQARYNLGAIHYKLKEYERAVEDFELLQELAGHRFETHFALGLSLLKVERLDDGIEALCNAIRLRPDHARTYTELGRAYCESGDTERALESAKVALKLDPESRELNALVQEIHIKSGQFDEAVMKCRKYLKKDKSPAVYYNLAVASALSDDKDGALDALRDAIRLGDEFRFRAKDDPAFAPLHDSSRYQDLIEGKPGLF